MNKNEHMVTPSKVWLRRRIYCRQRGEDSQRNLEGSRMNMARRLNQTMRRIAGESERDKEKWEQVDQDGSCEPRVRERAKKPIGCVAKMAEL